MKISRSIRELYNQQYDINITLEKRVKELLGEGKKKDNWFYKGRIKSLESFAQKLETGRFTPYALEDFFACTLVVENRIAIQEAIELVKTHCSISYQRPKSNTETHKIPEVFSFDDLRLYVRLKPLGSSPVTPLNDVVFEVQIKTFLQHAWSIATHDLIYKGNSISWSKARLAFQIKAMLEHAEISIEQVDSFANSSALALIDPKTNQLKQVVSWLTHTWPLESLPKDIVRLSQTVLDVVAALRLTIDDVIDAVNRDTAAGFGSMLTNLSPYVIIIKALAYHRKREMTTFLGSNRFHSKVRLFITPEMEIDNFIAGADERKFVEARIKSKPVINTTIFSVPPLIDKQSYVELSNEILSIYAIKKNNSI